MSTIARVSATAINVPMVAPYRFSFGSMAAFTTTLIEVEDADGVVGVGESPHGDLSAVVTRLGERLLGQSVDATIDHERTCLPSAGFTVWADGATERRAFGGIELALWDLRAKRAGVPLWQLLGGKLRDQVAFTEYFALREGRETTADDLVRYCAGLVESDEVPWFEGKVGVLPPADEMRMLANLTRAVGAERVLRVDANGAYTVATARTVVRRLADLGIGWLEDPCRTLDETERLREDGAPVSFSTHQWDLPRAARRSVPDAFCIDLAELGGLRRTQDALRACAALGIDVWFYSGDSGVMTAAYLHLSAAEASLTTPHQSLFRFTADVAVEQGHVRPTLGYVEVSNEPGLGVSLDRTAVSRLHAAYVAEGAMATGTDAGYGYDFRQW